MGGKISEFLMEQSNVQFAREEQKTRTDYCMFL